MLKVTSDIEITREEDGSIRLHGYKEYVNQYKEKISSLIIKECEIKTKTFDRIISVPAKNVQWEYETQNSWKPFSLYISSLIEDGYENQKSKVFN